MTGRLEHLERRRHALSSEIARERLVLAGAAQRLQPRLQKIDRVREDLRFFRERYAYLLIPVGLLALLNPQRTLKLALGAWSLWRTFDHARVQSHEPLTRS